MDWYALAKPLLFQLPAETAHHATIAMLAAGCGPTIAVPNDSRLRVKIGSLDFAHPVGLAAGMDKDAEAVRGFARLGFSHVEVGTVTARPQPGNPKPRVFRLPTDGGLINRFGFNNHGAAAMAERLDQLGPKPCIVGVNLGKSKIVPNDQALDDYRASVRLLGARGDYVVVNVSSPNTPGLRDLQAEGVLKHLLTGVRAELDTVAPGKLLLVKIAPDLADAGIDAAVDAALESRCDGLICTNTTIGRGGLSYDPLWVAERGAGGLSGTPVRSRSTAVLAHVARRLRSVGRADVPLVGVGGIDSAAAAWEKIGHGANLVQVYTGLIMRGPMLVKSIVEGLREQLDRYHLPNISAAVGRDL
ncbi:MAG: quinone-dependent dihydroorotate dehydrogenase [Planctomycetota bacterium]